MSKEKILPDLPPTPSETLAGWKKLREAIDKKDWDGARSALEAMGLSPKLVPVFSTALIEEKELATVEAAGEDKGELFTKLSTKLKFYIAAAPQASSLSEAEKLAEQIEKTRNEANKTLIACEAGRRAQKMRKHLKNWIPQLWGLEAITSEHSGHLSGGLLPTKTAKAAGEIKGMKRIDLYVANSWRDFDLPAGETPRRKYNTFAPSNNPLFPQKGI